MRNNSCDLSLGICSARTKHIREDRTFLESISSSFSKQWTEGNLGPSPISIFLIALHSLSHLPILTSHRCKKSSLFSSRENLNNSSFSHTCNGVRLRNISIRVLPFFRHQCHFSGSHLEKNHLGI